MPALIARPAPHFEGTAVMPNGDFKELSLSDFQGKYILLFFWPLDFTFVCPSEIVAFHQAHGDFKSRGVEIIGCSVDSHFTHNAWRNTPLNKGGIGAVDFPLLSDLSHSIAKAYGCHLEEGAVAVRALYLIDQKGVVRHITMNDLPIGRSVEEALRVVDALQFSEKHGEVCPANWKKGQKGMKASAEGVAEYMASISA